MLASQIKTASDLRQFVEASGHCPHFFTRETMRFFGDTMRNYGVRKVHGVTIGGNRVNAWELYRRQPVKHGLKSSTYFKETTFERVHLEADSIRDGWIQSDFVRYVDKTLAL